MHIILIDKRSAKTDFYSYFFLITKFSIFVHKVRKWAEARAANSLSNIKKLDVY